MPLPLSHAAAFSAIGCRTAAVCCYWMAFDAAADHLRSYNSSVELHALLPSVTIEFPNSAAGSNPRSCPPLLLAGLCRRCSTLPNCTPSLVE